MILWLDSSVNYTFVSEPYILRGKEKIWNLLRGSKWDGEELFPGRTTGCQPGEETPLGSRAGFLRGNTDG